MIDDVLVAVLSHLLGLHFGLVTTVYRLCMTVIATAQASCWLKIEKEMTARKNKSKNARG